MWKLLRNLVLAGLVLAGALKLLAWYEVGQDARRLSSGLGPNVQVAYDGISAGLNGSVTLRNAVVTIKRGAGADAYRADRLVFEAPNVFWLVKHALFAEDSWPAHFGLDAEGLKLPPAAQTDPHWFDVATLVPFENAGCSAATFAVADFRRMEVTPGEMRAHGDFRFDVEAHSLEGSVSFSAPQTASLTLGADLRQFDPKMLRSADAFKAMRVGQLSLRYDDTGLLQRRNAFCAQRSAIGPQQFVEQHLAAVQEMLHDHGVDPGTEVMRLYRRLVENGGHASVLSLPSSGLSPGSWYSTPPDELLRQLNVTARYGDAPPVMFRLSFAPPVPAPDAAVATEGAPPAPVAIVAAVPALPSAPALAPQATPPTSAGPTATVSPAPSPTAAKPVTVVQSATVQSAATAPPAPAASATKSPPAAPVAVTPPPKAESAPAASPTPPRSGNGLEEFDRAEARLAPPPKRPAAAPSGTELLPSEPAPPPGSTLALVWKPTVERLPATQPERRDYEVVDFSALRNQTGRFVRLITDGGKKVEGYIVSADESQVELRVSGAGGSARFVVARARVQEVQLLRRSAPPA